MKVIVTTEPDIASKNMQEYLIKNYDFTQKGTYSGFPTYEYKDLLLITSPKRIVHIDDLDRFFDPEYYIFASPHSSKAGNRSLTAHSTGNFGENTISFSKEQKINPSLPVKESILKLGGNSKELGISPALLLKSAILNLRKRNLTEFPVSLEVTHHGPTNLKKPLLFVEVGSSESEWNDLDAIKTVCETILNLDTPKAKTAIGFGGPHYAPNFTKRIVNTELAFGHICPKYNLKELNKELIVQMIEKTIPKPELAVLDWKGMGGESRQKVISWLEDLKFPWEKI